MDKVAEELLKIAKSLVAKTYPEILPDKNENRRLWRAIEGAVDDLLDGLNLDESPGAASGFLR